jgi:hypothetical protein
MQHSHIRLLHNIIDVGDRGETPPQPESEHRFVGLKLLRKPSICFWITRRHRENGVEGSRNPRPVESEKISLSVDARCSSQIQSVLGPTGCRVFVNPAFAAWRIRPKDRPFFRYVLAYSFPWHAVLAMRGRAGIGAIESLRGGIRPGERGGRTSRTSNRNGGLPPPPCAPAVHPETRLWPWCWAAQ